MNSKNQAINNEMNDILKNMGELDKNNWDGSPRPTGVKLNCPKHGEYDQREVKYFKKVTTFDNCPSCTKERNEEAERKRKEEEDQRIASMLRQRHEKTGVSIRNSNVRFKDYICDTPEKKHVHDTIYDLGKRIHDGDSVENVILTGKVGTGKTMIGTCLINSLYKTKNVKIAKLQDILRYIKGSYQPAAEYTEAEAIGRLANFDLLIIDEVGASRETDNDKILIFDIIDGRYQNMLPTMIISNLNIDGIKQVLGDRCVDRLRDGGGKLIGCNWESMRK